MGETSFYCSGISFDQSENLRILSCYVISSQYCRQDGRWIPQVSVNMYNNVRTFSKESHLGDSCNQCFGTTSNMNPSSWYILVACLKICMMNMNRLNSYICNAIFATSQIMVYMNESQKTSKLVKSGVWKTMVPRLRDIWPRGSFTQPFASASSNACRASCGRGCKSDLVEAETTEVGSSLSWRHCEVPIGVSPLPFCNRNTALFFKSVERFRKKFHW